MARGSPTMRGSSQAPPAWGIRPIPENASTNTAERAAITKSAASATLAPAPAAAPLTAASAGTGAEAIARRSGSYSSRSVV